MSAELRIVRGALVWGTAALATGAAAAFLVRGGGAAASVALAGLVVLANAGMAALASTVAGRISKTGAAMIALPSYAIRMAGVLLALSWLSGHPAIDRPVFAATFAAGVVLVVVLEARAWRQTPWLVAAFGSDKLTTEERA